MRGADCDSRGGLLLLPSPLLTRGIRPPPPGISATVSGAPTAIGVVEDDVAVVMIPFGLAAHDAFAFDVVVGNFLPTAMMEWRPGAPALDGRDDEDVDGGGGDRGGLDVDGGGDDRGGCGEEEDGFAPTSALAAPGVTQPAMVASSNAASCATLKMPCAASFATSASTNNCGARGISAAR
jgi:hypothetical protein